MLKRSYDAHSGRLRQISTHSNSDIIKTDIERCSCSSLLLSSPAVSSPVSLEVVHCGFRRMCCVHKSIIVTAFLLHKFFTVMLRPLLLLPF